MFGPIFLVFSVCLPCCVCCSYMTNIYGLKHKMMKLLSIAYTRLPVSTDNLKYLDSTFV